MDYTCEWGTMLNGTRGVIEEVVFTPARGTPQERRCSLKATVVDTTAYFVLLGMVFDAGVREVIDTWAKTFSNRYEDAAGMTELGTMLAP